MKLLLNCLAFATILLGFDLPSVVQGVGDINGDSDWNCKSISEIACATNGFNILCQALEKTGLYLVLDDFNSHTLFAPGDSAFRDILKDHLHYDDIHHCPLDVLKQILLSHIHADDVIYKVGLEFRCGDLLGMASDESTRTICEHHDNYNDIKIFQKGGGNSEDDKPELVTFNIDACNGVIHVVDQVILPSNLPHSTHHPTHKPTLRPSHEPNSSSTRRPTKNPTRKPTRKPIQERTSKPSRRPTRNPASNGSNEWNASCSAHSKCDNLGGDCCPTTDWEYLDCCSGEGGGGYGPTHKPTRHPTRNPTSDGKTENASCSAAPICNSNGLTGDCCPTNDGTYLNCCAEKPFGSCSSNLACRDLGLRGECCPTQHGHFLDCCSHEPHPGNSYCAYSPNHDCYISGWPKCCANSLLECSDEQPECEIGFPIVGDDYCTYSPDYKCYENGFPTCCLSKDDNECPDKRQPCNASCDSNDSLPSIKDFVCGNDRLEFLCYAINKDNFEAIESLLDSSGTYTLFAPTDNAFDKLGDDKIRELFDGDASKLKEVLLYQISNKTYFGNELTCDNKIDTELGDSSNDFTRTECDNDIKFQVGNGNDEYDKEKWPMIIEKDIVTCNGVVHLINNVILPP